MPPWLRAAMPAVFVGDRLIYAAGIGMDASGPGTAAPDEPAAGRRRVCLHWHPNDPEDPRSAGFEPAAAV